MSHSKKENMGWNWLEGYGKAELEVDTYEVYLMKMKTPICSILLTVLLGHAIPQMVGHQSPTVKACVGARVSPCGICGGQSGIFNGFSL
jgi:hypothetical protein